ncbi:hypothetical protein A3B32_03170 [Candidatus Uhrbacteria bacterium RIFCSPLOWO2_01_FULL_53_9]|uniref:Uncharacterized protein n=3 Tax=Candidatus Uhriibacteriota TaxID=1752732 RepID=A0A1F7UYR9_9BACT|nr:MAG: hypothetical protein A3C17_01335 [Candidatus Uhrbacteria bacterium RIFCSPHIGHO2_02_FULL_53_13]OGL83376.1 MAG: hypothetical protein A3B32_03170 [Candidatus Uhrbacteria bacterium RIFCSPLOWO2_01_FULL_53_9]OGL90054.1 MAG: hypothetical protein A3I45_04460 [Candidatus Uhrbacteria bacterium RIFCSPLOWO2_02_FULL_53_10]
MSRAVWLIFMCSILLWGLLGVTLSLFLPGDYGGYTPLIASLMLWLAVVTTGTGVGVLVRRVRTKEAVEARQLQRSFRQAIWLACIGLSALWLSHFRLLTMLISVLLIAVFALLELWFLFTRR